MLGKGINEDATGVLKTAIEKISGDKFSIKTVSKNYIKKRET